jgi:hypothetical protein
MGIGFQEESREGLEKPITGIEDIVMNDCYR